MNENAAGEPVLILTGIDESENRIKGQLKPVEGQDPEYRFTVAQVKKRIDKALAAGKVLGLEKPDADVEEPPVEFRHAAE